jgi:DNA-binding response OmpR family regulator
MENFTKPNGKPMKDEKPAKPRILLVEDDPNLSFVIKEYLELMDYETTLCNDGESGLAEYNRGKYNLVILDVMMPKKDGFAVAEDIRKVDDATPIIFLTAKTLKDDRIKGFQSGCDDYITKPFSTEEFSLRIKAILKRCMVSQNGGADSSQKVFNLGKYTFDFGNLTLNSENSKHSLTRKEGALLKLLCMYKNKLLSREIALKTVWGGDDYFFGRSMDVFITKLRRHLKDDPSITITNVHGSGFKLEIPETSDEKV